MAPCGSCVWGKPFQCVEFNATPTQIHENAYFKWHCSLGEMQNNVDGGCKKMWMESYKNELKS